LGALRGQVALEQRARPGQAGPQIGAIVVRQVLHVADAALGLVEQRAHRRRARGRSGELGRIEVEEEAQYDGTVAPDLRQTPQHVAIRGHHLHRFVLTRRAAPRHRASRPLAS
jgi:hypothetical protein